MKPIENSRLTSASILAVILCASILICHTCLAAPAQVTGAFGYQLGNAFDLDSTTIAARERLPGTGLILATVTPPIPNQIFTKYMLRVTRDGHRICTIYASASPPGDAAWDLFNNLKQLLTAKYGPPSGRGWGLHASDLILIFGFGDRTISLSCNPGSIVDRVTISYDDLNLEKQAGEKASGKMLQNINNNGL
ncbi:MAG: hypothetical protein ABSE62_13090 [Chthoniobacteraceae bacterium]|jgi:hypothetical protein